MRKEGHQMKRKTILLLCAGVLLLDVVRCFNISLVDTDGFLEGLEFLFEDEDDVNDNSNRHSNKPLSSPISKIMDFTNNDESGSSSTHAPSISTTTPTAQPQSTTPPTNNNNIHSTLLFTAEHYNNNNDTSMFEDMMSLSNFNNSSTPLEGLLINTPMQKKILNDNNKNNAAAFPVDQYVTTTHKIAMNNITFQPLSKAPIDTPTMNPSLLPTSIPTALPSLFPTIQPTTIPSLQPSTFPSISAMPSLSPTLVPTLFPSAFPTYIPSLFPTTFPSESGMPSNNPSSEPSYIPSMFPSSIPSLLPTTVPTTVPTGSPSNQPSLSSSPSMSPTDYPSTTPTTIPTSSPSTFPSWNPSATPSYAPSSSPSFQLQQQIITDVAMEFDDCAFLDQNDIQTWQEVTADHIKLFYPNSSDMEQLYVNTTLTLQNDVAVINQPENNLTLRGRSLQVKSLWILFDVYFSIRSPSRYDISTFIGEAFGTQSNQDDYIAKLQDTKNIVFSAINFVQVYINGTLQQNEILAPSGGDEVDAPRSPSRFNAQSITGIAFGVICVLLLLAFIMCVVLRRKHYLLYLREDRSETSSVEGDANVNNFIQVHGMEDVSTLGDPMYPHGGAAIDKETTVGGSTISVDYDYTGAYGGVGTSTSVSTTGATGTGTKENHDHALLDDDITDDEQFIDETTFTKQYNPSNDSSNEQFIVIDAPSGKLGVVIDAPNGFSPKVYSIKETSVLLNNVQVGDKLVSIDGQDTTGLSATSVSKLISSKIYNSNRQLVFMRGGSSAR